MWLEDFVLDVCETRVLRMIMGHLNENLGLELRFLSGKGDGGDGSGMVLNIKRYMI